MNTIIEKIRAEVERQREEIRPTDTGEMKVVGTPTQLEQGWLNALSWMEKVLDTLQEQPVKPSVEDAMKELDKKIAKATKSWKGVDVDKMLAECRGYDEQPVCEGLEEEIDKRWKEWISEDKEQVEGVLPKSEFAFYARHFAQWQKERDEKELSEKIAAAYQLGLADKEKMMMKEAVEGKIGELGFHNAVYLQEPKWTNFLDGFKKGDKVRIIIVKEEQK